MPEAIEIKWLQDVNGNKKYPVTHTKAVFNDNNDCLDDILNGMGGNLPSMSGHAGEFLSNNGTTASWKPNPAFINHEKYSGTLSSSSAVIDLYSSDGSTGFYNRHSYYMQTNISGGSLSLSIQIASNLDYYIWIHNMSATDLVVTINSIEVDGSALDDTDIFLPDSQCEIASGYVGEISVIANANSGSTSGYLAFLTWRTDLSNGV